MKRWAWAIYKLFFLDGLFSFYFKKHNLGQVKTSREYWQDLGIEIEANLDRQLPESVILYANHKSWFDPLFIAAIVDKKWKVVATNINTRVFEKWSAQMIGVPSQSLVKVGVPAWPKHWLAAQVENFNQDGMKQTRRRVVEQATAHLEEKGSIMIFPTGGSGKWAHGLANLAIGIRDVDVKPNFWPVKISGVSEWQLIQHGWKKLLGLNSQVKVELKFGQVIVSQDLPSGDYRQLTEFFKTQQELL